MTEYCLHELPEGEGRMMICTRLCRTRLNDKHVALLAALSLLKWKTAGDLKREVGILATIDILMIARYLVRLSQICLVNRRERNRSVDGFVLYEYSLNGVLNFGGQRPAEGFYFGPLVTTNLGSEKTT